MIRSMTAYGRSHIRTDIGFFSLEVHSVNRRNLDINIYIPKELFFLDMDVRKWISSRVERGGVVFRMTKEVDPVSVEHTMPEEKTLKELKSKWEELAVKLGLDPKEELSLPFLIEQVNRLGISTSIDDVKKVREQIHEGFEKAMQEFIEMKEEEGRAILLDIEKRLQEIREGVDEIKTSAREPEERFKNRLMEKIREIQKTSPEDEERVHREMIIFAEKIDITEELTRLYSHLSQLENYLKTEEKSIGKTLDFLLQEMNRETNTINAKTPDEKLSRLALTVRSHIEKIREQVHNVE